MARRAKKRTTRRDVPRVRRVRRRPRPVRAQVEQATHVAWHADEPLEKKPRRAIDEDERTGLRIHRSWSDRGGVVHETTLIEDTWFVLCDPKEFRDEVRRMGSSKLRISFDQVTCLWCAIRRRQ